ncbi:MAG: gliding motility-associated C-terminal domain-containing protein [Cytophagaceae bacterium]|jgi:gliding motility-associated-like protein|nr:gliding motility-associated C-terminal domain-containing protein [Cytophagaceae bacterium]
MKLFATRSFRYSCVLLFTLFFKAGAEGTKQLRPTIADANNFKISLWSSTNQSTRKSGTFFSTAEPNFRINIRICNLNEVINMGFNEPSNTTFFRLRKPDGTTVNFNSATPAVGVGSPVLTDQDPGALFCYALPNAGAGRIANYNTCVAGPLPAAGGYAPLQHIADQVGDYYIEFNSTSPTVITQAQRRFDFFDITVWNNNTSQTVIDGRLWSYTWDLAGDQAQRQFEAELFIYTKDSVVTAVDFNGMRPINFVISANSTGCTNTGNPGIDRKSRVGNINYPEYRIFLNDPDPACFPERQFGCLNGPVTVTGCDPARRCINMNVTRSGKVEVLLDIDQSAPFGVGYDQNSRDRIFVQDVQAGDNCIPWDTRDGQGNLIAVGTTVNIEVNYFNGNTHVPMFDAENHDNGYSVRLVRPAAFASCTGASSAIRVYWDDEAPTTTSDPTYTGGPIIDNPPAAAIDGLVNLTGCDASVSSCHRWRNRGENGCFPNCPETMNTWWYANIIKSNTSYTVQSTIADANRLNPPGERNDTTVCSNVNVIALNGLVSGEITNGTWGTNGTGTFSNPNSFDTDYNLSAADKSNPNLKLFIRAVPQAGRCSDASDTMYVEIIPGPIVTGATPTPVCKSSTTVIQLGGVTNGSTSSFQWETATPGGTFIPNAQTMNAQYQPSASVLNSPGTTTIKFILRSLTNTGSVACPAAIDSIFAVLNSNPTVNATDRPNICTSDATVSLTGTITGGTAHTITWTGNGSFSNGNMLTPVYTPTAAEKLAGSARVVLRVVQTSPVACSAVTDTALITFVNPPIVSAGLDDEYCRTRTDSIVLNGSAVGGTLAWLCLGCSDGSFMGATNTTQAIYNPGNTDLSQNFLRFVLTSTAGTCPPVRDTLQITLNNPSSVNVGNDTLICANNPCVTLTVRGSGAGLGSWASIAGGTFTPSINSSTITYCLSASELAAAATSVSYTVPSDGNCGSSTDNLLIVVDDAPKPNAGPDLTVCDNNQTVVISGASGPGTVTWSGGTGVFNFNPPNSAVNPQYTLSVAEGNAGFARLVMTMVTNNCAAERDTMFIRVTPSPTVNAGPDQSVCANNASNISLSGFASAGTVQWTVVSGVAGTITNPTSLNASFTPSSTPPDNSTTVLRLTSTLTNCNTVSDQLTITYTPSPVVTITSSNNQQVCKTNPNTAISATPQAPATGIRWETVSGTGTFSPNNTSLSATYIPSITDLSNGFVTLRAVSTGNGNCNAVNSQTNITISYQDPPRASAGPDQELCESSTGSINLNGLFSQAVNGQRWTSTSACNACFGDPNALSTTYTPSAADVSNGSVLLILSSTGGPLGCLPVSDTMRLSFNAAPTVNAGPDLVVCTNQNSISLNGSGTNVSQFTWTVLAPATGTVASVNSAVTSYNISATDKTNGLVQLRLTAAGNPGCASITDVVNLTFTQIPVVNAGPDRTVCLSDIPPISLEATGASGTWSASVAGTFSSTTVFNPTFTPSAPSTGSITFTYAAGAVGACPGVSDQVVYTIIPGNTLSMSSNNLCTAQSDRVSIGANSSTGSGFWTTAGTGSFVNAASPATSYIPSGTDVDAGAVKLYFETSNNGFCRPMRDSVSIGISNLSLSAGPDQNQCGTPANFTLSPVVLFNKTNVSNNVSWTSNNAGVSISPTAPFVVSGTNVSGAVVFTMTVPAQGFCPSLNDNVTINFTQAPSVSLVSPPANACENTAGISIQGSITGVVTTGIWESTTGGIFSPSAVFNNATQNTVTYIPSALDRTSNSIVLTLKSDNSLCGVVPVSTTITINRKPVVNAGDDVVLCANNNVATLNGSITNSPIATGTWKSSSNCTTCFTAGTAFPAGNLYDADTNDVQRGFVTLTLTSVGNMDCPGDSDKVIITFSPAPEVNAGPDRIVCGNNGLVQLAGTVNTPFTAQWSGGNKFSDINSLTSTYDANGNSGIIQLILTSSTNAGLCLPDRDTMQITVTPSPVLTVGNDRSICSDTFFVSLNANSNVTPNPVGLWTTNGTGTFLNGNASSDTAVYIPSAAERLAAPTTVQVKFTTAPGLCASVSDSMLINIEKAPEVEIDNGATMSICANQTTISLSAAPTVATTVAWSSPTSPDSSAFTITSPTTATYTITALDRLAGSVTITARTIDNRNCFSASDQIVVNIQPLPVVNAGADVTICQTTGSVSLSDASVTNAAGGVWQSVNGGGVFGLNTTINGTYFLSNCCTGIIDTALASITLQLTSTENGLCPAATDTKVITLTKLPVVNAGPDQTVCIDSPVANLSASTSRSSAITWSSPDGGSFAPNTSTLTPAYTAPTVGSFRVVATAAGLGTCGPRRDTAVITVRPRPTIDLGLDANICSVDENSVLTFEVTSLSMTNATGVLWSTSSGPLNLSNPLRPVYTFSTQDINNGQVTIFAVTNAGIGTCLPVADQMTIFIEKAPVVNIGPDVLICENTGLVPLGLNAVLQHVTSGSWSSSTLSAVFSNPIALSPTLTVTNASDDDNGDQVEVIFTSEAVGACLPDADTLLITYTNAPVLSAGPDQNICFTTPGETLLIQLNGGVAGTWNIVSGDGLSPTSFSPSASIANPIYTPSAGAVTNGNIVRLRFTPSDVCYLGATDDVLINLHQTPILTTPPVANICETSSTVALSTTTNYVGSVIWTRIQGFGSLNTSTGTNPVYTVNPLDKNITQVTYLVSSNTLTGICAPDIDTITFRVIPAPIVNAGPNQIVCSDLLNVANAVALNGSASQVSSISWSSAQGSFANATSLTSRFTPTAFTATITLTGIGNAPCANVTSNVLISSVQAPVVATLANKDTCAKLTPFNLSSALPSISPIGTTTEWSIATGNGIFIPNNTTLNGQYIPTATDTARGFVVLVLTATNTGVCTNLYDDTVRFNLEPQPKVNGGVDQFYCAQVKDIPVTGSINRAGNVLWQTAGSGTFNPANGLNTVYTLSSADSLAGGTVIWLRTDNASSGISCPDDTDFVAINLSPAPVAIVNAGFDQYLCIDNETAQLNGFILNANGGLWKIVKGSGSLSSNTDLDAVYRFSSDDKNRDTIILTLESVGHDVLCLPTIDTVKIFFTPTPEITITASDEVCAIDPIIQLGNTISQASINQGQWTTSGDGVFVPNAFTLNAQYIPGAKDIEAGRVGFLLTATANGTCAGTYQKDTVTTILPFNKASSTGNNVICANAPGITLLANSSTGSGTWTRLATDGSPATANGLSIPYVPGPQDLINQKASFQFKTTGTTCAPDSVVVLVDISPAPSVEAAPDFTVCADVINGGTTVAGTVLVAGNGVWTTNGTGSFVNQSTTTNAGITTVSAVYIPSSLDTANKSVRLRLTSTENFSNGAICNSVFDELVLNFMPRPTISATPSNTCSTINGIQITGTVSQDPVYYPASTGMWSIVEGSGTIAPSPFSNNASYFPSGADLASVPKTIKIVWSSQNAGSCEPVRDTIQLVVNSPIANAGPDRYTCNTAPVTISAIATPNASRYTWVWLTNPSTTLATTQAVTVTNPGDYELTMTDIFGCEDKDTMKVEDYTPPPLSLPASDCYEPFLFVGLNSDNQLNPLGNFQWKFNNIILSGENLDSVRVNSPGTYTVEYNLDACRIAYGNTIINDIPRVLSPDVIACANATADLEVMQVNSPPNSAINQYNWTTSSGTPLGSGSPAITVPTATTTGVDSSYVRVGFTDGNGCSSLDSVLLVSIPRPVPDMPEDSMECVNIPINLIANRAPSNINSLSVFNPRFEWTKQGSSAVIDNDTEYQTTETGRYYFRVSVDQCVGIDSTDLIFQPYPLQVLPSDKTLCMDRALSTILDAGPGVVGNPPNFTKVKYSWSGQGATENDTNQLFTVLLEDFTSIDSEDNTYFVTITNQFDYKECSIVDTATVHDVCAPRVFPPTAFHPGDPNSMDAFFTIHNKYVGKYELRVFNRWGEIIFQSTDRYSHWDGTYRGEPMPIGVYPYTIVYEGKADEYEGPFRKEGRVVLVR